MKNASAISIRTLLLWGGLLVALFAVNRGITQREAVLSDGRLLLLELAPADPRSLMQGDYMALRFVVADDIHKALHPETEAEGQAQQFVRAGLDDGRCGKQACRDGYVVLVGDANGVARFVRVQTAPQPVGANEITMRFRERDRWNIRIASNAWFFPEGQAERYAPARYGELRVAADGTALLTGMRDANRKPL